MTLVVVLSRNSGTIWELLAHTRHVIKVGASDTRMELGGDLFGWERSIV